jgi:hypothetical protein
MLWRALWIKGLLGDWVDVCVCVSEYEYVVILTPTMLWRALWIKGLLGDWVDVCVHIYIYICVFYVLMNVCFVYL